MAGGRLATSRLPIGLAASARAASLVAADMAWNCKMFFAMVMRGASVDIAAALRKIWVLNISVALVLTKVVGKFWFLWASSEGEILSYSA